MTFKDALRRAVATFVFGALSVPFTVATLDADAVKAVVAAGLAALLNFAYRAAEAYLNDIPEGVDGSSK